MKIYDIEIAQKIIDWTQPFEQVVPAVDIEKVQVTDNPNYRVVLNKGASVDLWDGDTIISPIKPTKNIEDAHLWETFVEWTQVDLFWDKQIRLGALDGLDNALALQRRWSGAEFHRYFIANPTLLPFAKTLVWGAFTPDGTLLEAFHILDDLSLENGQYQPRWLLMEANVGLVHPLHLTEQQREDWAEVLHAYQKMQVIQQVGREIFYPTESELALNVVSRAEGSTSISLPPHRWRSDIKSSVGNFGAFAAVWTSNSIQDFGAIGVKRMYFRTTPVKPGLGIVKLGQVPPIVFSEAVRDLLARAEFEEA